MPWASSWSRCSTASIRSCISRTEVMARIEVFSGPDCCYCTVAETLFKEHGPAFEERDVVEDLVNHEELRRRLPRSKAIPQIFIDGEHIGGSEDLSAYLERIDRQA
ncbi:MAG: glutaredoxin [Geminicoccaceae bacterium]